MDFEIPREIRDKLRELDAFIAKEIKPLEEQNLQYFDHRREHARTDWDHGGVPRREWEELLAEMRRRADRAGHYRYALPKRLGGQDGTNLAMAVIREHLAAKGLGLHLPERAACGPRRPPWTGFSQSTRTTCRTSPRSSATSRWC